MKKFLLGNNKDEYEKAKFSYIKKSKANLVNKARERKQITGSGCNGISRVRI